MNEILFDSNELAIPTARLPCMGGDVDRLYSRVQPFHFSQRKIDPLQARATSEPKERSLRGELFYGNVSYADDLAVDARYRAREPLFGECERNEFIHIVVVGAVRLQRTLSDGRRLVSGFALPGDLLGLWSEREAGFSAEALGEVATRSMTRAVFSKRLNAEPRLMDMLRREFERELAICDERAMLLSRFSAREKVAAFLVHMRDRWRRVNGQSIYVALPMTRQDIGDHLGMTIETVSRMLAAFAREKLLVVVPEGVRLLDVPRLKSIGLIKAKQ